MANFTRRSFLGAAAALAAPSAALLAARKRIPIGVQLYSVTKIAAGDLPGTLAGIKKMGYDGVEFAGYYNFASDAKGLRKLLDDNGLKVCGTHIQLATMDGDGLKQTIEFNQTIGNPFLVVPSLPKQNTATLEAWAQTADRFREIAETVTPLKMHIGYHNHSAEFTPVDGQMPWDVLLSKAGRNVFGQLDIGHCQRAGADPVAYLKKYPGRALTVHVKEFNPDRRDALVGEGKVNWPAVFAACESVAGTQWYIIEEESRAYPGLEGIEKSIQNLKKLLG